MILGIGTDMVALARIETLLKRQGERFTLRCFTALERIYVEGKAKNDLQRQAAGYAKRWAAKEAAAKALGLGVRSGIFLKDFEVITDRWGAPSLILHGGAKQRLTQITPKGMTAYVHVSLSDEPPLAMAYVVISGAPLQGL